MIASCKGVKFTELYHDLVGCVFRTFLVAPARRTVITWLLALEAWLPYVGQLAQPNSPD